MVNKFPLVSDLPKVIATPTLKTNVTPASTSTTSFFSAFKNVVSIKSPLQVSAINNAGSLAASSLAENVCYQFTTNRTQITNACGPTMLFNALDVLGVPSSSNAHNVAFASNTIGHTPLALIDIANRYGLKTYQSNSISNDDATFIKQLNIIENLTKAHQPVGLLGINNGGSNGSIRQIIDNASKGHYVLFAGYVKDEYGQTTSVYIRNSHGATEEWSLDKLKTFWRNNLYPAGQGHFYFMTITKPTQAGTFQDAMIKQAFPNGCDQTTSTFKSYLNISWKAEKFFYEIEAELKKLGICTADAINALKSALKAALGAVENGLTDIESALKSAGSFISRYIAKLLSNNVSSAVSGVVSSVGHTASIAGATLSSAASEAYYAIGNLLSSAENTASAAANDVGSALGEAASAVGDVASSAGSAIGDAASDAGNAIEDAWDSLFG